MGASHWSGPLVTNGGITSSSGTNVFGQRTVVRAAASIEGALSVAGAQTFTGAASFTAAPSFPAGVVLESGNTKAFAAGTYIGTGGATAALVTTGLTTVTMVFMSRNKSAYSGATTGNVISAPCIAASTPSKFYPIMFSHTGAPGPVLNTVAGTFRWLALGAP